jgi:hypothetical protein
MEDLVGFCGPDWIALLCVVIQALYDAFTIKVDREPLKAFWAGSLYKLLAIAQTFQFEIFVDLFHKEEP